MSSSRIVLAVGMAAVLLAPERTPAQLPSPSAGPRLAFVENLGQWRAASRFVARAPGMLVHVEAHALALQLVRREGAKSFRCRVVRMCFEGAGDARIAGAGPRPGASHFMNANGTHAGARAFARVRYRGLWNGVDLRLREQDGRVEYDVLLAPGARLADVVIRCEGARGLAVTPDGKLAVATELGTLHQSPPVAWQVASGREVPVACRFRLIDERRYGFVVPELDRTQPLVIDPGFEWGTFLGGKGYDYARAVGLDGSGDVFVAGYTTSPRFPATRGSADSTFNGGIDAFVARLSADGKSLRYCTYIGGSGRDWATGLVVSPDGKATVCGYTESRNFPATTGALERSYRGAGDGFVARLNPAGSALEYATYLGGRGHDQPNAIAIDGAGRATVVGETRSGNFPTTPGAYDTSHAGGGDAFVARLDAAGKSLVSSTLVGGRDYDPPYGVAVDRAGNAVVAGETYGSTKDFPTTAGAYDRTYSGGKSDGVVFKVSADGKRLLWSTLFGGNNWDPTYAVTLDLAGNPTIAGETWSTDLPVGGSAFQKTNRGGGDAFVARLDAAGSKVVFATYLGGKNGEDSARSIAIDPFGAIVVSGWSKSSDFPLTPGARIGYKTRGDGFVSRFAPDGTELYYATFFGASGWDAAHAMALDDYGGAALAGEVWWQDFPASTGSFDTTYNDGGDAYAARTNLLPRGVSRFGLSTPACTRVTPIGITAEPREGARGFAYVGAGAPPSTAGLLLIGGGRYANGVPILGIRLHIDLLKPIVVLPAIADRNGRSRSPMLLFPGLRGARLYAQHVWANTGGCGRLGTFSASDGLDLVIR